jgi:predicted nucleic acid-binding protein
VSAAERRVGSACTATTPNAPYTSAPIAIDASAAVLGLLNDGEARSTLSEEAVVCPHLADAEVAHTLRAQVLRGVVDASSAGRALDVWARLGLERVEVSGLLDRIWQLRENLSAYDATYVAVAEAFEVALMTADGRLARAAGPRCSITVVRR